MAPKGSLGKYTPGQPSPLQYKVLVTILTLFSLAGGYLAGIQPTGKWRYFSWHPFLMTCGMVGFAGIGSVTKKIKGYANTKLHAFLAWASIFCSLAGLYVIYQNKEINGFKHLKSYHAWFGISLFLSCFGLGMVGTVVLHPDFGLDNTNKTIRLAHKMGARLTLIFVWITAILGLQQLIPNDLVTLSAFAAPLVLLIPFVLM